jgi:hypothetical protein
MDKPTVHMGFRRWIIVLSLAAVSVVFQGVPGARAQEPAPFEESLKDSLPKRAPYSPYVATSYPRRPLFGDTHLHTSQSFDACVRLSFGHGYAPHWSTFVGLPRKASEVFLC